MESQKITFYNEISLMMYGFGDSHTPNPETVRLVEEIVLKQLQTVIQEALKYSDGKNLKGEELVFLLRHNKHKMQRFIKYLKNKQIRNMLQSMQSNITDDKKLVKNELLNFIEYIDETGEFTETVELDEVKYERELRADRISQSLDEQKYLEFCKARCTSFSSKGTTQRDLEKLRVWVDPKKEINLKLPALDVLSYFAYQTVAEIIDFALLARTDSKCGKDPLNHLKGCYYTSTMFNGKHRFNETNLDYSRVHSGQPAISVNEIKEIMRRVHLPQPGKLNFGGKFPETHYIFTL